MCSTTKINWKAVQRDSKGAAALNIHAVTFSRVIRTLETKLFIY